MASKSSSNSSIRPAICASSIASSALSMASSIASESPSSSSPPSPSPSPSPSLFPPRAAPISATARTYSRSTLRLYSGHKKEAACFLCGSPRESLFPGFTVVTRAWNTPSVFASHRKRSWYEIICAATSATLSRNLGKCASLRDPSPRLKYAGSYASSANPKLTQTRGSSGSPNEGGCGVGGALPQWMTRCVNTIAEPASAGTQATR
mmetsp:Transcript_5105/g.20539  ORF Transcript_5105/g.20539 Transcript_5105/m.20539 type:complete len:207 (+) Transcript_5105:530-1150(+)